MVVAKLRFVWDMQVHGTTTGLVSVFGCIPNVIMRSVGLLEWWDDMCFSTVVWDPEG